MKRMNSSILPLIAIATAMNIVCVASAASILNVDFDSNSANVNWSATQVGFVRMKTDSIGTTSPATATYAATGVSSGSLTVALVSTNTVGALSLNSDGDLVTSSVGGLLISRDRMKSGVTISTNPDLYRDFVNCANPIGIEIDGLDASTTYSITFYTYDYSNARTTTYHLLNPNGSVVTEDKAITGTIASVAGDNGANLYSLTLIATSTASGKLYFDATSTAGAALMNGIEIATVPVPEAASALIMLGFAGYALLKRKC